MGRVAGPSRWLRGSGHHFAVRAQRVPGKLTANNWMKGHAGIDKAVGILTLSGRNLERVLRVLERHVGLDVIMPKRSVEGPRLSMVTSSRG